MSFLYYATMLTSYVADGAYYCRGTFQAFADALVAAAVGVERAPLQEDVGGLGELRRAGKDLGEREVVLDSDPTIVMPKGPARMVEQGRAVGVLLENGQRVSAPVVISNADARQTIEELAGAEHFPARYLARLSAAPISPNRNPCSGSCDSR